MKELMISQLDYASERITGIQEIRKMISVAKEGVELGMQQQYLDESGLYIKQIMRVKMCYII
jgi:hypothetical protein